MRNNEHTRDTVALNADNIATAGGCAEDPCSRTQAEGAGYGEKRLENAP